MSYAYSVILLFNLNDLSALQEYLKSTSTRFNTIIQSLNFSTGNLTVNTSETMTENDISELNSRISSYLNPALTIRKEQINIQSYTINTHNLIYTKIVEWNENGSRDVYSIIISSKSTLKNFNSQNTTYHVRVYDFTHNTVLSSGTFSNTIYTDYELLLTNFQLDMESKLEVHVKCDSSDSSVYINNVYIKF